MIEQDEHFYNDEDETDKKEIPVVQNESIYSYSRTTKQEFDELFPTEYKEFTNEDYRFLNQNLILYKDGNTEATQYIISVFHRFVKKYVDFICNGTVANSETIKYRKQYDKSLTKFISLFISKEKKSQVTNTLEKNKLFAETCVKIQTLFSKFEYWDIYNELVCALLNMANKYKVTKEGDEYYKPNGTFHMYVGRCFHFDAYNILTKMIGDPLAHLEVYSLFDDYNDMDCDKISYGHSSDNENVSITNYVNKTIMLKDTTTDRMIERMILKTDRQKALDDSNKLVLKEELQETDPYEMESLNFNWTNGSTCSEVFDILTPYEREILVLSFAQNKTDSEIASLYGCHRITIIKHKKIAVQKIKDNINK